MNVFSRIIGSLQSLKLNVKLGLFLVVLAAGITLIGFSYNSAVEVGNTSLQQERELGQFRNSVEQVQIAVLESVRFQKDFQVTKKLKALERFDAKLAEAEGYVKEVSPFLKTENDKDIANKAQNKLKSYQSSFYEAVELQVELGLNPNSGLLGDLNGSLTDLRETLQPLQNIQLQQALSNLVRTKNTFFLSGKAEFIQQMEVGRNAFLATLKSTSITKGERVELAGLLNEYVDYFNEAAEVFKHTSNKFEEVQSTVNDITPLIAALLEVRDQYGADLEATLDTTQSRLNQQFLIAVVGIPLALVFIMIMLGRSILKPVSLVQNVVDRVTEGDFTARTGLHINDEIGNLGQAFDRLLDERVTKMLESEEETQAVNKSIISLLRGVSKLSRRDLTVQVPVAEDVTGTLSDALNLLTTETAKVLQNVNTISERVNMTSSDVKLQSDTVREAVKAENEEIKQVLEELTETVNSMMATSQLAQATNKASTLAIATTENALGSVTKTIDGINQIRETIGESEKRIKRLGERSQEISGMVNLINGIAERTHILALNASMHAASAGEAGRGFMVIADEVQTLAESSRDATSQISTLVKNIQVDTSDTVNSMNTVISQVVEGTRLAEEAGTRMKETQTKSNVLVNAVQKIAKNSENQVVISKRLRDRAEKILASTEQTDERLIEQSASTDKLVGNAEELIAAVSQFTLPAQAEG